jgi:hypothetical protein
MYACIRDIGGGFFQGACGHEIGNLLFAIHPTLPFAN